MAMGPDDIALLLQQHGSSDLQDEYDEDLEPPEVRQQRTALLSDVLAACQSAWYTESDNMDMIAEKLGDGSRDVAWRIPFGDSGILDFFLQALAVDGLRPGLYLHSLRLVGNSCADTDENRARVVQGDHFPSLYRRLQDESLIPFTIPVLYNILVDYEPAQLLASQTHLNQHLMTLLSSPSLPNYSPFVTYFCKILTLLVSQEGEANVANPQTVQILFALALSPAFSREPDEFVSLTSVALAYLAFESFQVAALSDHIELQMLLNLIYHAYTSIDADQIDDEDVATALKKLQTALLTTLADITAHEAFTGSHSFRDTLQSILLSWLRTPNHQLQSAACIALGNLSRSDDASISLVNNHAAHEEPMNMIANPEIQDPQVLHSALSFLKNLAIHVQNKPLLGGLLEPGCVPRIYQLDTLPQVQFAAVSLTRLLLVNCPSNVRRICSRLSQDKSSPSHDRTSVHSLIALFGRTDAEPTKLEAARALAALLRVLHSNPVRLILPEWDPKDPADVADEGKRRTALYETLALSQPLEFLVSQQKWPILRSEAWFVFALLCRSHDGSAIVLSTTWNASVAQAIIEAVKGSPLSPGGVPALTTELSEAPPAVDTSAAALSGLELEPQQVDPQQKNDMVKIDRENVVVLLSEMLRNWADEIPPLRSSMWQDLVKEGTEMIVAERAQSA